MSQTNSEPTITERISERPSLALQKVRQVSAHDLGIRFFAGAITSVASGMVTLAFGARAGGLLLAFPAILAASLTLIAKEEDTTEAREDARGAVVGGLAMAAFAAVAALTLGRIGSALALLLALVVWFAAAFLGYFLAWFR